MQTKNTNALQKLTVSVINTIFVAILYTFLYSLSFSTIVIWIFYPFDLLLFNLLFIQLPTVLLTGTTLHGYLSGRMSEYRE